VPRKTELATDFAVAEECDRYSECKDYRDGVVTPADAAYVYDAC
jgi:hypothetical protein